MTTPWVAPVLTCGLGNRLFQTVAAIKLAEDLDTIPVFFLPRMCRSEHGNFSLLQTLCPLQIIEKSTEWDTYCETQDKTIPPITQTSNPIVLSGFFQNSENFTNSPYLKLLRLPRSLEPSKGWAIHFRIGDYSILPHHQIAGLQQYYYHLIHTKIPKGSSITLYSDSLKKLPIIAQEITEWGYTVEIFNSEDVLKTLMHFASKQGGSICGNSTFAWWAAYFANQQSDGSYKAFFPDIWMNQEDGRYPNLFTLPFTQSVKISSIPEFPKLSSFSY
jgi:hypothetical protein